MEALKKKCASIANRIGSPFDMASMMGPIISKRQLDIVETLVESAKADGATIVCGGARMTGLSPLDGKTDLSKGWVEP
jgi:acyl-CoA reductase-like NAD-dependent aldehyde dehydrogenase